MATSAPAGLPTQGCRAGSDRHFVSNITSSDMPSPSCMYACACHLSCFCSEAHAPTSIGAYLPGGLPRLRALPTALHSGCAVGRFGDGGRRVSNGAGHSPKMQPKRQKGTEFLKVVVADRGARLSGRRSATRSRASPSGVSREALLLHLDGILGLGGGLLVRALSRWWVRLCMPWACSHPARLSRPPRLHHKRSIPPPLCLRCASRAGHQAASRGGGRLVDLGGLLDQGVELVVAAV